MGTSNFFPGGKAAGAWADHSSPSSDEVKEWADLYPHSPSTPSWRGAQLKQRDNFTFTFYEDVFLISGIDGDEWFIQ
jgi:hypothetical protein